MSKQFIYYSSKFNNTVIIKVYSSGKMAIRYEIDKAFSHITKDHYNNLRRFVKYERIGEV